MNIQTTKIELVKLILNIENHEFMKKVIDFIKKNDKTDIWDELNQVEQKEIMQGIDELDSGDRVAFTDFLKKIS